MHVLYLIAVVQLHRPERHRVLVFKLKEGTSVDAPNKLAERGEIAWRTEETGVRISISSSVWLQGIILLSEHGVR